MQKQNLFVNSNALPKSAYNLDLALFNRIVIIPFDNTFLNDITFLDFLKYYELEVTE